MIESNNVFKFNADLDAFSKKIGVQLEVVLKKVALTIFESIVKRTPVDTGVARASWVIGVNAFAQPADIHLTKGEKLSPEQATEISMARSTSIQVPNPFSFIMISNYLPYIMRLEYGWSRQAPAGMVRLAVEEEFSRIKEALK